MLLINRQTGQKQTN